LFQILNAFASWKNCAPRKAKSFNSCACLLRNQKIANYKREEIVSISKSCYLPILTVTNPNKKKNRIVWDAAADVNEMSLNHTLLKGPGILVSLMGVLLRFREGKVAAAGDIREMFRQV